MDDIRQNQPSAIERHLRTHDIIGSKRLGIPGILPMSERAWFYAVKNGNAPAPIKFGRICYWRESDIRDLLADLANQNQAA
ncbi:MAG: AlpA family transcriptional regulator [Methyloglobulus sp.]|nr:AlpA family transcriptional regulator [Methyloglobulus sp.]